LFLLCLPEQDRVDALAAIHAVVCPHCGAYQGNHCNCRRDE
jgi:ribosomal protein L32